VWCVARSASATGAFQLTVGPRSASGVGITPTVVAPGPGIDVIGPCRIPTLASRLNVSGSPVASGSTSAVASVARPSGLAEPSSLPPSASTAASGALPSGTPPSGATPLGATAATDTVMKRTAVSELASSPFRRTAQSRLQVLRAKPDHHFTVDVDGRNASLWIER